MKRVPSYVEYKVYFDLTEKGVSDVQIELNKELGYSFKCVYYFVERTHSERESVIEDGILAKRIVDYYSMVVVTSRYQLKKEHIVAILEKIPNGSFLKGGT